MKVFQAGNHRKKSEACEWILNHEGPLIIMADEPKRSLVRNAQLHAVISDIADQKQWDGEYFDIESWKRLLCVAWMRATGRRVKIVRAIDGTGIDVLYQRTSKLTEREVRELIQYVYSWGVDNDIVFKEPTPEGWRYPEVEKCQLDA